VTNTGKRAGDDVAQLYLDFPDIPGAPRVALRGFQRVSLAPGEQRTISFDLSPRDLSAVTADGTREVMPGNYTVSIGSGQPDTGIATREARFSVDRAVVMHD
jgi:beta-glucosidase